ncbi:MAG TPA: SigE family RNA polymerase sigma factor [Jatrophihabitantaceae bacterium]|jgi:RNA polymerase sigma-70 factor (sigma-E family)
MEFEDWVAERRGALFRFAVVLTGDPVLADEVVSNTLTVAYERWALVSVADNVNAYVRRMVVNEYLGWRRRLRRVTPWADLDAISAPLPDHSTAHADQQELVHELRRLPSKQRAAIVLRYYEGLTFAEIADLLGSGENAVRSNISRGLQKLRISLTGEQLDEVDERRRFPEPTEVS